ncbi:cystathionine beta-synthase [Ceraceosorus bombacis]|uniref:cystathionine beta-synthase n=1 Tax=Ceraceosorus bombacis TaxID=401625 RepID=A0A0N7LBK1_9BASI|nr:cystathionine beta-synthase [Ceraceosorus bombacis]
MPLPNAILPSALSAVGDTPLIRLNRIPQSLDIKCNVLVKCEFFNAGGSVKDRIAGNMLMHAEAEGLLIPGKSVIVEPTSGNTGVGLALAAAIKGYRCIIVLPEKMSAEKVTTLKALGAEVVRTPTEAAHDDPRSNIMVAKRLSKEIPDAVILDQYNNPNNPLAHRHTAQEIIDAIANGIAPPKKPVAVATKVASDDKAKAGLPTPDSTPPPSLSGLEIGVGTSEPAPASVPTVVGAQEQADQSKVVDVLVAGVGTGGTISGMATRLRESDHNPDLHVVGVDPFGSTLAEPATLNTLPDGETGAYKIEGIGYDFVPNSLDKSQIQTWIKTKDEESFEFARRLIRQEGLLCGGSSGAAMAAAMRFLQQGGDGYEKYGRVQGKNVVVVLPDSIRNYITKPWLLAP